MGRKREREGESEKELWSMKTKLRGLLICLKTTMSPNHPAALLSNPLSGETKPGNHNPLTVTVSKIRGPKRMPVECETTAQPQTLNPKLPRPMIQIPQCKVTHGRCAFQCVFLHRRTWPARLLGFCTLAFMSLHLTPLGLLASGP